MSASSSSRNKRNSGSGLAGSSSGSSGGPDRTSHSRSRLPISSVQGSTDSHSRRSARYATDASRSPSPSSSSTPASSSAEASSSTSRIARSTRSGTVTSSNVNPSPSSAVRSDALRSRSHSPSSAAAGINSDGDGDRTNERSIARDEGEEWSPSDYHRQALVVDPGSSSGEPNSINASAYSSSRAVPSSSRVNISNHAQLPRTPSRTQLRHARAVHRLSQEAHTDAACEDLFKLVAEVATGNSSKRPSTREDEESSQPASTNMHPDSSETAGKAVDGDDVSERACVIQATEAEPTTQRSTPSEAGLPPTLTLRSAEKGEVDDPSSFTPSSRGRGATPGPSVIASAQPFTPREEVQLASGSTENSSPSTTPPNSPPPSLRSLSVDTNASSSKIRIKISLASLSRSGSSSSISEDSKYSSSSSSKPVAASLPIGVYERAPVVKSWFDIEDEEKKKRKKAMQIPLLKHSLAANNVDVMADSIDFESREGLCHEPITAGSYLTPVNVAKRIHSMDYFIFAWICIQMFWDKGERDEDTLIRLALERLPVELGESVLCTVKGPHYTFFDVRGLASMDEQDIVTRAVELVELYEGKGIKREDVVINIPATEAAVASTKILREQHNILVNLVFVSVLTQASACASAGAAAIAMPVGKILRYYEHKRNATYRELGKEHPGIETIQAAAAHMWHNEVDNTRLIGTDFRDLDELEHFSCLDAVCLTQDQMTIARTKRLRLRKPGNTIGPDTIPSLRAKQAPYPPICASPTYKFRYSVTLSAETRNEAGKVLFGGLETWEKAIDEIEGIVRLEVKRRLINLAAISHWPPDSTTVASLVEDKERARKLRRQQKRRSSTLPFPSEGGELDDNPFHGVQPVVTGYREREYELWTEGDSDSDSASETDQMVAELDEALATPEDAVAVVEAPPSGVMLKDIDDPDDFDVNMDTDEDFVVF